MKLFVKKIIFCSIIAIGILVVLLFRMPVHTETNLMSLMNDKTRHGWPVLEISDKFSSVMNIVVESSNEKIAKKTARDIVKELNTEQFNYLNAQSNNFSLKELTNDFISHQNYIVGDSDKKLLQNGEFRQVANKAIKQISESMMPSLVSIKDDPFLLLSNFIIGLQQPQSNRLWFHCT